MTLYVATTNPGKLREFAAAAHRAGITVLPLPGLGDLPEPVEDGTTYLANAELKARAYSLAVGHTMPGVLVLADDSGLEVAALAGAPGVRSARFADDHGWALDSHRTIDGRNNEDERNNDLLLHQLADAHDRRASYVCALVVARDGEPLHRAEATCSGEILRAPQGTAGFGYDPLFYLPQLDATMAELDAPTKWQLGHRGQAFRALLALLD